MSTNQVLCLRLKRLVEKESLCDYFEWRPRKSYHNCKGCKLSKPNKEEPKDKD